MDKHFKAFYSLQKSFTRGVFSTAGAHKLSPKFVLQVSPALTKSCVAGIGNFDKCSQTSIYSDEHASVHSNKEITT